MSCVTTVTRTLEESTGVSAARFDEKTSAWTVGGRERLRRRQREPAYTSGRRGPQPTGGTPERSALGGALDYSSTLLSLTALRITDTELSVIAALAQIGLIRIPKKGYSTPAATGTPMAL